MKSISDLVLARLRWEAACERLQNAFSPPPGAPLADDAERSIAFRLASEALAAVEKAWAGAADASSSAASTRPEEPDADSA